jgi:hypothetical protein
VQSPTTFTVPGMNPLGTDLVGCTQGLPQKYNSVQGIASTFVPPDPDRLLACRYRGTGPTDLRFVHGLRMPAPVAIAAALNAAPSRTSTPPNLCPPYGREGIVLVFGYSYRLTVVVYITASGCAFELNNDSTIIAPAPTLATVRKALQ